jgi:hypothetical protein
MTSESAHGEIVPLPLLQLPQDLQMGHKPLM